MQYFNHGYGRTGTLWEGRYKASVVDAEAYLLTCHRYIELNPVRAAMVVHPAEYPWSSFHYNALGQTNPNTQRLVTPHPLYEALGSTPAKRQLRYRELFEHEIPPRDIEMIRKLTQQEWALGNDRFKDEIAALTGRRTKPLPKGGDRRSERYRQNQLGVIKRA